jgi:Replication-relaxation
MPKSEVLTSINLQNRDIVLLRGLFECRVMTNDHATALYFDGKSEAAKKRLQKIKAAGLISERPRRAFEPSVLFLTRKGLVLIQKQGILTQYPTFDLPVLERRARVSDLTIRHELEVMDVKTAFQTAAKTIPSFTITEFSTWPLLNEFRVYRSGNNGTEVLVKPDGFISIHEKETGTKGFAHDFFLEVDRSTETQDVLIARASCYYDYYKSGKFAVRNGAPRDDYKLFPFRVLIVFKTAERRNNTAERLLQKNLPILKQVCLSTLEEVTRDPLGAIWINPAAYREATKGSPFDPERQNPTHGYRHQPARELFVEKNVRKFRLLTEASNV